MPQYPFQSVYIPASAAYPNIPFWTTGLPRFARDFRIFYTMLLLMRIFSPLVRFIPLCTLLVLLSGFAFPQQLDPNLYDGLRWRMIGPHRGGRTVAVAGVESQPNLYYFGGVGGGVWKTTNGGVTWEPIFDGQPIASIGAI